MDKKYVNIVKSDYATPPDKINVAYFGSFYKGSREHHEILNFLKNDNTVLHLFILNYFYEDDISIIFKDAKDLSYDTGRLRVNKSVPMFEMLNIASKMDYLYLEDTGFSGPINPYLPSKYATYKTACQTSNVKIIAKTSRGSILSQTKDKHLIKTTVIDADFVNNL
jgi:hypothetical protein